MKVFKSKIDTWLIVLSLVSIAVAFVILIQTPVESSGIGLMPVLAIVVFVVVLPVWIFTGTKYVVNDGMLLIRSGPFRWTIAIKDISGVNETRNPISSPALSLNRLKITYSGGKSVLVSPIDISGFRKAIGHPER